MLDMVASQQQRQFGLDKRDTLPQFCLDCDVRFACHGGCPKDRFIRTPDGEPGLNYLCPGFKAFFHHVDPADALHGRAAAREPRPLRDRAALRHRGREARPQRPLHLRLRSQVEALPRFRHVGRRYGPGHAGSRIRRTRSDRDRPRRALSRYGRLGGSQFAAAISYRALFSLVPLATFVATILAAGAVVDQGRPTGSRRRRSPTSSISRRRGRPGSTR